MASWEALRSHIFGNYRVADDQGDFLRLNFDLGDGRSQSVFVRRLQTVGGEEWGVVESAIGELDRVNVHRVLESIEGVVCGGLSRVGDLLTLRDSFPLDDLDINEFESPLAKITTTADDLERAHVGADAF